MNQILNWVSPPNLVRIIGFALIPSAMWGLGIYGILITINKTRFQGNRYAGISFLGTWGAMSFLFLVTGERASDFCFFVALFAFPIGIILLIVSFFRGRGAKNQQMPDTRMVAASPISNRYYFSINDADSGPFTLEDMRQFYRTSLLSYNTLIFREGEAEWREVRQFDEIIS